MEHSEDVEATASVKGEEQGWSPTVNWQLILAFVLGFLALSPAILGIYWELLLP